jgi:hypothetical protein
MTSLLAEMYLKFALERRYNLFILFVTDIIRRFLVHTLQKLEGHCLNIHMFLILPLDSVSLSALRFDFIYYRGKLSRFPLNNLGESQSTSHYIY